MKILFLSRWVDATSYFRCLLPMKYLQRLGYEVRHDYIKQMEQVPNSGVKEKDIEWADVIIFQRPIANDEVDIIKQVKEKMPKKVLIGEYDDDYDNVPEWNPGYTYLTAKRGQWAKALEYYDACTVSTYPLKELLVKRGFKKQIEVVKNSMDIELIDSTNSADDFEIISPDLDENYKDVINFKWKINEFKEYVKDKVVIAWFGSRTHYCDLDIVQDELNEFAINNRDVVFLFIGFINWRAVLGMPYGQVFFKTGEWPFERYVSLLKSLPINIALAPVVPNEFNRSKSGLKVLECMAMGYIPVASEFDTYESDYFVGHLAGYKYGDWTKKLEDAVKQVKEGKQKEIAEKNRKIMEEHYNAEKKAVQLANFYKLIMDQKNGG